MKNLKVKERPGKFGVTRLIYSHNDKHIGSARLLGSTVGDITVRKCYQRKGYGSEMLHDLIKRRGARAAIAGSMVGYFFLKKFVKKNGGTEAEKYVFRFIPLIDSTNPLV